MIDSVEYKIMLYTAVVQVGFYTRSSFNSRRTEGKSIVFYGYNQYYYYFWADMI